MSLALTSPTAGANDKIIGKIWRTNITHKRALIKSTFYDSGWEWRVESAKAIRYQISGITNTWLEDDEISDDLKAKTEAQFRLNYELQNFEFFVAKA